MESWLTQLQTYGRGESGSWSEIANSRLNRSMKETGYLLQAFLILAWWIGLSVSESFFAAFQFPGIPPIAFKAFLGPDLFLIAGLSLARAYRKQRELEWIILGAFAYATLYCIQAAMLTQGGYLGTVMMTVGLAYNTLLCFHRWSFLPAKHSGNWGNGTKTTIQIISVWFATLVFIPHLLVQAFGSTPAEWFSLRMNTAIVLFTVCGLLGLSSSFWMVVTGKGTPIPLDQTNALVTSGPYRYVRNPMAIAGIGQGLAVAFAWGSIAIFFYTLLGVLVWQLVVRPMEEEDLVARFGKSYEHYRMMVPCWYPRLTPYQGVNITE
jgi:protein-S-isoprenylcysteine O-methyltransferase Ste14